MDLVIALPFARVGKVDQVDQGDSLLHSHPGTMSPPVTDRRDHTMPWKVDCTAQMKAD